MSENLTLDHFMWVTPDLDATVKEFTAMCGVAPAAGGVHPGVGTRNFLMSLGPDTYLEIMGPDPAQTLEGTLGGRLASLEAPTLYTYALRTDDIAATFARMKRQGYAAVSPTGAALTAPLAMRRETADGTRLSWDLFMLGGHAFGLFLPFFIQWHSDRHPARTSPRGCSLADFWIGQPEPQRLKDAQAGIGWTGTRVMAAGTAKFHLMLDTPNGPVGL
jgi:hypothetical protein